jgi:hypothetical protein
MVRQYFVALFCIFTSPFVMAEWQTLSDGGSHEPQQYIDLHSVKQAGPMAIYRQVQVLSQGAAVSTPGVLSTLLLYEYDCMNTKFRLLEVTGFSMQWAKGQAMTLSVPSSPTKWLPLPLQALGQKTFDLLCPDGKDNK